MLLPIADQQDFLGLVEKLIGNKPEKDGDVYTANVEKIPFPVYFRFANKYCYVTVKDREAIDKENLLDPTVILPGAKVGTLSATLNIDRIPADLKNLVLGQMDLQLAKAKEKQGPNETPAQAKLKVAIINEVSMRIKSVVREGGPVELRLDLDRASGNLMASASLAGKPDSELAASIADLGKVKSLAASLVGRGSALSGLIDVALPEKLRTALGPVIDEGEKKVLEKQDNPAKRDIVAALLNAVKPTLKNGVLDAGFDLRGPGDNGIYTAVAGVKVKDGEDIDKTLRKVLADLPAEVRDLVKLDFDKVDRAVIHRVTPQNQDKEVRQILGDNPVYLAVRDDAVLLGLGDKGLEALKDVLASAARPSRLVEIDLAVSRLAPLMEKENKGAVEAARKAFAKEKDGDKVHITLEGGPTLQVRLVAKTALLKFFNLIDEADGKKANQ